MLDVFSLIFVADTKIIVRYDFVAPLKGHVHDEKLKSNLIIKEFKELTQKSVLLESRLLF